ncbi:hypothetical protein SAY87_021936 [Trapa incisa]|uniref:Interactor of constitutive active ROPs 1 n=1 Tax=Trapa incisa TaxID=236973 RepID=A0AAN7PT09_9MYRT|nr:hypothetical protein SAY87_021936 [Trapa incisa]
MPKPSLNKGAEMQRKQSPRGPLQLRTSSSNSDSSHHRSVPEKSPKIGDRRSPRSVQSEPVPKKLGTRIADLESQLGQAQQELKSLKKQLVNAEAAKKEAQEELEKKKIRKNNALVPKKAKELDVFSNSGARSSISEEVSDEIQQETDVFEVPMEEEKVAVDFKIEKENNELAKELGKGNNDPETVELTEEEKHQSLNELALKEDEISLLKSRLEEKENEIEEVNKEKEHLKKQVSEMNEAMSSSKVREEGMAQRLNQMEEELKESRENSEKLKEKLEALESAKESLEAEMKTLRIQTEQWRKAADAAAAVLAAAAPGMNHFVPEFDAPGGYMGFVGSPENADDADDGMGGRKKGFGIRAFGDLWKKKGHK